MRSALLPHSSSWFIHARMWGRRVHQPPPCGAAGSIFCQLQPGLPCSTICHLTGSTSRHLAQVLSAQLPVSTPPTGLGECFFFNSLVVRLPYIGFSVSSGCFLFLNLLLSFFCLCKEAQCVYLCLHLGQKPRVWIIKNEIFVSKLMGNYFY